MSPSGGHMRQQSYNGCDLLSDLIAVTSPDPYWVTSVLWSLCSQAEEPFNLTAVILHRYGYEENIR